MVLLHLAVSLVLVGAVLALDEYRGHKLVRTQATTETQLELLDDLQDDDELDLDFWTEPSLVFCTTIRCPPKSLGKLRSKLLQAGLKPEVVLNDVQGLVDNERAYMNAQRSRMKPSFQNYRDTYLTFPEIQQLLFAFARTYPNTMRLRTAGKTFEGRDLLFAAISDDWKGDKPAIWIDATTHAREWITTPTALYFIEMLASGATSQAEKMLDDFDWFIMPVHNPDGYVYTHTSYRFWRKNRAMTEECKYFVGVDLNRNWDANFGGVGSSGNCSSYIYRGKSALSERETKAVHNMIESLDGRVKAFFDIHSFSQILLVPYGFGKRSEDFDELYKIAKAAMKSLKEVHGTNFTVGAAHELLYPASGGAFDHAKLNLGAKYSYTYELRPSSGGLSGFDLPPSQIRPVQEETWASMVTFAELIHEKLSENGNGDVHILQQEINNMK